jgi:hypothetical protein
LSDLGDLLERETRTIVTVCKSGQNLVKSNG